MAKFSTLLLTLALFTTKVAGEKRPPDYYCFDDEVMIDLSNPSAVRPLIYTLTQRNSCLPSGLVLDRCTGVVSGVLRDVGFQNAYNISAIGTDPSSVEDNHNLWHASTLLTSKRCTGSCVSRFLLINTDTNKIVRVVCNGDTIDLGCAPTGGFSMEVETYCEISREAQSEGDLTSRVDFTLDGIFVNTETTFPYALGGHNGNGMYMEFPIQAGEHVLTATPYNPSGDKGFEKTITFTIVEECMREQIHA